MTIRTAAANWKDSLKEGTGQITLSSGDFTGKYSFDTRFEQTPGTNPEELIGAALAACFSMAMSAELGKHNYQPVTINTTAKVHLNKNATGFTIDLIELETETNCPNLGTQDFSNYCEIVKQNCPIAKALAGSKITVHGRLI